MDKLLLVKTEKANGEVVVTLPKEFGIKENEEYTIIKGDHGVISLVPKDETQLIDRKKHRHQDKEVIWDKTTLQGREWDL
jgi:hypothetical protein